MIDDSGYNYFGHRYQVREIDNSYETQYENVPVGYGMDDLKMVTKNVRMVTIKLPMESLDDIINDLEMKVDEVRLRRNHPQLNEMYQKYKMMLELYK